MIRIRGNIVCTKFEDKPLIHAKSAAKLRRTQFQPSRKLSSNNSNLDSKVNSMNINFETPESTL